MHSRIESAGRKPMSKAAQRVVVIQDASRDISSSAIGWALDGLSLKPGDELTLLGVLHQVNNPMGYRSKVDSTSMVGTSQNIINEELTRKEKEYENSIEILQLTKVYNIRKVIFHRRVLAASSPKVAVVQAVKELQATWIILDRQMKKEKKYFLERLSCGISRMKRNNNIELLRGPKDSDMVSNRRQHKAKYEMLPEPERGAEIKERMEDTSEEDELFSLELSDMSEWQWQPSADMLSTLSCSNSKSFEVPGFHEQDGNLTIIQTANAGGCMPCATFEGQVIKQSETVDNIEYGQNANINEEVSTSSSAVVQLQEPVENSVCSYCEKGKASAGWKDFTYTELQAATKDFSTENFLSEGGFGSVYQGKLENGHWVAVKQYKHASSQGEKEFISEVHVLSKARHKNVVTLLGSCSEGSQRLLVYEFICNGSLDKHLSGCSSKVLSWRERIKIALGAASGLNYLHQNNIIHRDMRPNNILVTHAYEALIGDFGLAKTKHDVRGSSENNILGAFGYLAPEYAESGNATTKTDVYSFGVVLLELITGQNVSKTLWGRGLVGWAIPLLNERRYPELIDEQIQDSYDVHQLFWMVSVAEGCLRKDPNQRPTMKQVQNALQCIMDKETVCGLTRTSVSSTRSTESPIERETTIEEILSSKDLSNKQMIQMNEAFSIESPEETFSRRLLSQSMGSDTTNLQSGENYRKRGVKSRIHRVSYDEMLS